MTGYLEQRKYEFGSGFFKTLSRMANDFLRQNELKIDERDNTGGPRYSRYFHLRFRLSGVQILSSLYNLSF